MMNEEKTMAIVVKNIKDEDFLQYKEPSMFVGFSRCNFKCGLTLCQNSELARAPDIEIAAEEICNRYGRNPITKAIVLGGLDPFDTPTQCLELCGIFRERFSDKIVIYTGYTEKEIKEDEKLNWLHSNLISLHNVIIKYGRYIPGQLAHYDEILGIKLANDEQYARYWQ